LSPPIAGGLMKGQQARNKENMIHLESRCLPSFGIGFRSQRWPRARHYVITIGRHESRVIAEDGTSPSVVSVVALLVSGLFL